MNSPIRSFVAVCFAALVALVGLPGQTLQLADGKVLLAKVDGVPDGEGLRVKRLDNGGVLDLRWEHLTTSCANTIKRQFDLMGDTQDEILVRADEEVSYRSVRLLFESLRAQGAREVALATDTGGTD